MVIATSGATNICFTGGEPFLQPSEEFHKLLVELVVLAQGLTFEAFTNGTLEWPTWAMHRINFVMDWKLTGSGENPSVDVMMRNACKLKPTDAIKFTVASEDDLIEAVSIWGSLQAVIGHIPVFVGPVSGKVEPKEVSDWIFKRKLPWRLNIQTHKYIYGDIRGI